MRVAMSKRIDRRTFVRSALTAGAGVLLAPTAGWSAAQKARLATEGAFAQGVASGEPATDAITLWTRLSGVSSTANVGYEVARDAASPGSWPAARRRPMPRPTSPSTSA
jgi:alkaline phosphatase D